jgi:hypothetical protein
VGVQCGIYKGAYNVSTISHLNLLPLPPVPGAVSMGIIFAFACTYTQYSSSYPLSLSSPTSHWCQHRPPQPALWFCRRNKIKDKKKNRHFCWFEIKIATQGVSLWYFHAYIIYLLKPHLVHLLQYSSLLLSPLPMVAPASWRFLYSFLTENTSTTFKFFVSFPSSTPPLNVTSVTYYCCICFRSIIHIQERTCSYWPSESG